MEQKSLLNMFFLLLAESIIIFFLFGLEKTGSAFFLSRGPISNVAVILMAVFIFTLFSILLFLKFLHHKHVKEPDEGKLSLYYVFDSLEDKKPRNEIIRDLEDRGFRKKDILEFIDEWEKNENSWEKIVSKERSTGH
ncbi:hypothetical protein GF323_04915 [Candidatus Woesearchaeota archaeon]|nr:hypothetical protein [Candidatus Woesearchaeota archaeon]